MGLKIDPQLAGIIVAICVVLLTIVFYLIYRRSKTARRGVMITGVSSCGKTLLFARLIHEKYVNSHTSIQENVGDYETDKGHLQLVDIPGHERLREKYLEQYKKTSRGLIYVIDSTSFQKDIRDIAEYLHVMLTDPVIVNNCKNILIFCNKQDYPTAKGLSVIKALLEKEMNTVRMTKASQLTSTEESGSKHIFLGREDADFEFSQCTMNFFDFAEGYALNKTADTEPNIEAIEKWLNAIA